MSAIDFAELTASEGDLRSLRSFYEDLYVHEFPDPNERESLDNMVAYLRGCSGPGIYRIILALRNGRLLGGSISDYLTEARSAAIEFLVVDPALRGNGIGSALLRRTEELLNEDACRRGEILRMIAAEIDDPSRALDHRDLFDPLVRLAFWDKRGYVKLDFPYVQPALSAHQQPVLHLMLGAKLSKPGISVPSPLVDDFLRDYLRFAMRINPPEKSPEYRAMHAHLVRAGTVSARPLKG